MPYATLSRRTPHADSVVRRCETWLAEHFREANVVRRVVASSGVPERTLKRRFKSATGSSLMEYVQNLRIEAAKRLLESTLMPVDEISAASGYTDPSFFRRLFKNRTGLTPGRYRRMFRPLTADMDSGGTRNRVPALTV
ncbi:MAG TPA: AraC family transcriptional regulator [Gammaproteobacteria bacterium]